MATKSKSTKKGNFFLGLISWACMMLLIFALSLIVACLLILVFIPDINYEIREFATSLVNYGNIPEEFDMRVTSAAIFFVIDLLLIALFRRSRKLFESRLAELLGVTWVEIKIAIAVACVFLAIALDNILISLLITLVLLYIFCLDIGTNNSFFKKNIARSVMNALDPKDQDQLYTKKAQKRFVIMLLMIVGIIILAAVLLLILNLIVDMNNFQRSDVYISITTMGIIAFAIGSIIATVASYFINLKKDLNDLSLIMKQIEEMYGGNLNAVNVIPPNSNFFDMGMQLNMIRTGIEDAVDEGVRADMTKVELITNMSHDIKTPLTSVVTYIELLKKEPNLPEHVNDYIKTLSNKADRLSNIVQDVFEVSKAATGNINLNMDNLDIGKLLQQTLAEMDETMSNSPITWRVDIPDSAIMIRADGQKLYRVFQNLIKNATQYSLEGSRAYITLRERDGNAEVSVRNIAKNEIDSTAAESLTGRFVRGDKNRTTEGSGLGLSIAKSFTEACNGQFVLQTDGDIFLVNIIFPIIKKEAEPTVTVSETAIEKEVSK